MDERNDILAAYKNYLSSHIPITQETWNLIAAIVETGTLKKGDLALEEGKTCKHIDFIYQGALRAFSNKDGLEITTGIYLENGCVTSMKSLSTQTPSSVSIQALEQVMYARIQSHDLKRLYDVSTEIQGVGRAILESMVIEENEWKEMYSMYDPEERYLFLLKKSPAMVNRVSLQHIASFLGMRRETLSRIRNRTARNS